MSSFDDIKIRPSLGSAQPVNSGSQVCYSIQDSESPKTPHNVSVRTITARHIRRLVGSASDYLGKKVTSVVILVPEDFTDEQKDELEKACHIANVQLVHCFNDAVCALYFYDSIKMASESVTNMATEDKLVLVADYGATRSEVSILFKGNGLYSKVGLAHIDNLGGTSLDAILIDHFAKEFLKKHRNSTDPRKTPRSLEKLRLQCEATRRALSNGKSANLYVESLIDGVDFSSTINRTRFEILAAPVFNDFTSLVIKAIENSDIHMLDIELVVLIGGTSHTPRIAANVRQLVGGEVPIISPSTSNSALNPNEVAARGAAMQINLLQASGATDEVEIKECFSSQLTNAHFLERGVGIMVAPYPPAASAEAGTNAESEIDNESFVPLAKIGTPIPLRRAQQFRVPDNTPYAIAKIFEAVRETEKIPVSKPAANGNPVENDAEDDEDFSDDKEDEDQEPEMIEKRIWKVWRPLAEMEIEEMSGVIEVELTVNEDRRVRILVRELKENGKVVRGDVREDESEDEKEDEGEDEREDENEDES